MVQGPSASRRPGAVAKLQPIRTIFVLRAMAARRVPESFLIAFSFAGGQREFVREIVTPLETLAQAGCLGCGTQRHVMASLVAAVCR